MKHRILSQLKTFYNDSDKSALLYTLWKRNEIAIFHLWNRFLADKEKVKHLYL